MNNNLFISFATKDYIDQAKQLFVSLLMHGNWQDEIMLLTYNVPKENLLWFKNNNILIKEISLPINELDWEKNLPQNPLFSNILSGKLTLFSPEFKKWKKIVYMDADIIIRGSIKELTNVSTFGAVKDVYAPTLSEQLRRLLPLNDENKALVEKMKETFNLDARAFNAGVFSFDSKIIRINTLKNIKLLFQKYGKLSVFGDQLILNLFFYQNCTSLPLIYNAHVNHLSFWFKISAEDFLGHVLHFAGSNKPWHKESPFHDEWNDNFELSNLNPIRQLKVHDKITPIMKFNKISFALKSLLFCNLVGFPRKTELSRKSFPWFALSALNALSNKLIFFKIKNPVWKSIDFANKKFFLILNYLELKLLINLLFLKSFLNKNILRNIYDAAIEYLSLIKFEFLKPRTSKTQKLAITPGNPDFCFLYFSCNNHFQLLFKSLQSLERLMNEDKRKVQVFLYFDKKDYLSLQNELLLKQFNSLHITVHKTLYKMKWGGVRLIINELTAFLKISQSLETAKYIAKVDSDILFASGNIFKLIETSKAKLIGNKFRGFPAGTLRPFRFSQGGCYFLHSEIIPDLYKINLKKIIKETSRKTFVPFYNCPEDAAIFNLVSKVCKPLLLNFYLPEFKFENCTYDDLRKWSIIHLEKDKKNSMSHVNRLIQKQRESRAWRSKCEG